ncbi:MAG: START-like domain-containing protein [Mangrovibacterium sp.]
MQNLNKITLEFALNCSINVLFKRLSTASGLAEWFADDVKVDGEHFTFIWDGYPQEAELICRNKNENVCFRWLEHDELEYSFEFKVNKLELTEDVSLIVIDTVEFGEEESQRELWETQIEHLRRVLGA